jgi:hypothetical protein
MYYNIQCVFFRTSGTTTTLRSVCMSMITTVPGTMIGQHLNEVGILLTILGIILIGYLLIKDGINEKKKRTPSNLRSGKTEDKYDSQK